jgi:hypothetical protein
MSKLSPSIVAAREAQRVTEPQRKTLNQVRDVFIKTQAEIHRLESELNEAWNDVYEDAMKEKE